MTRRVTSEGAAFDAALRDLLDQLVDGDDLDVRLEVAGVDLAALGRVRLTAVLDEEDQDDDEDDATTTTDDEEASDDQEPEDDDDAADDEDDDEDGDGEPDGEDGGPAVSIDELDEEADAAADFLEGVLDGMGLPGDLQIRVHEDHAEVEIINVGSGRLIGRRGQTLDAIQELLRCALQRQFQRRARVMIDVEGYRQRRLEKYLDKARDAIDDVQGGGDPVRLEPMDVYERKAVHQLVAEHEGVTSSSRGREPTRRVIIEPGED